MPPSSSSPEGSPATRRGGCIPRAAKKKKAAAEKDPTATGLRSLCRYEGTEMGGERERERGSKTGRKKEEAP